ncbi:MAG: hypothetical protein AAGK05_03470 [Pseudomonadota bacterium]
MDYDVSDYKAFLIIHKQSHDLALELSDNQNDSSEYKKNYVDVYKRYLRSSESDSAIHFLQDLEASSVESCGSVNWSYEYGFLEGFAVTCSLNAKNLHGGSRTGSGRKKSAPTKQIRVDENLAGTFKSISDAYRSLDSEGQIELLRLLHDAFSSKTNL